MTPSFSQNIASRTASDAALHPESSRLDYLDAARAFALLLGVVFHAALAFSPVFMGWAVQDISTSPLVLQFFTVSHSFRMQAFFLLAGFFGHMAFHRKGAGEFIRTRVVRILVPFVVGWFLLRPLIVSGWVMGRASLRGDFDFWVGIRDGFQSLSNLPTGIFTGSHLWFLYYLAVITALALLLRALLSWTGPWYAGMVRRADTFVAWLASSPLGLPVLAVPTAGALWSMRLWGMDTPDQSLKPHVPVLLVYGAFFVLGWMCSRQRDAMASFARLSIARGILAAIGMVSAIQLGGFQGEPSHPRYLAAHVGFVLSYALMMWSLVFLALGVFRKFFQRPRAWVRYGADSSYWVYLIHLPIVVWLQVAVAEVRLPWACKLGFISLVTIAVSLLTYDLFVRSTWIGGVLNGGRRDRRIAPAVLALIRLGWRRKASSGTTTLEGTTPGRS